MYTYIYISTLEESQDYVMAKGLDDSVTVI